MLSPTDDVFFREHMYANYGDLASSIKSLLDDYTTQHKMHESLSSIEDMQRCGGAEEGELGGEE